MPVCLNIMSMSSLDTVKSVECAFSLQAFFSYTVNSDNMGRRRGPQPKNKKPSEDTLQSLRGYNSQRFWFSVCELTGRGILLGATDAQE